MVYHCTDDGTDFEVIIMSKTQQPEQEIKIPPAPTSSTRDTNAWRPDQVDPELANLAMAKQLMDHMGVPSKISPAFNIRKAIFASLNHTPKNRTGIDTSIRLTLYNSYELGTINENGVYFDRIWAYLMKPKYILSGYAGMPEEKAEEDPWYMRILGGKKKNEQSK